MPIKAVWHDAQQTIIRFDISGHWTWNEALSAIDYAALWCAARPNNQFDTIYVAADEESLGYLPSGAVTYLPMLLRRTPPNVTYNVIVLKSGNPLAVTLHHTLLTISRDYRRQVGMVDTLAAADALIAKQRHDRSQRGA
jgi:hypothetical protein